MADYRDGFAADIGINWPLKNIVHFSYKINKRDRGRENQRTADVEIWTLSGTPPDESVQGVKLCGIPYDDLVNLREMLEEIIADKAFDADKERLKVLEILDRPTA